VSESRLARLQYGVVSLNGSVSLSLANRQWCRAHPKLYGNKCYRSVTYVLQCAHGCVDKSFNWPCMYIKMSCRRSRRYSYLHTSCAAMAGKICNGRLAIAYLKPIDNQCLCGRLDLSHQVAAGFDCDCGKQLRVTCSFYRHTVLLRECEALVCLGLAEDAIMAHESGWSSPH
jgi:hypothetical protein